MRNARIGETGFHGGQRLLDEVSQRATIPLRAKRLDRANDPPMVADFADTLDAAVDSCQGVVQQRLAGR